MALVSVIVPCFNASKTILQTLNSIQKQEMDDFECLIINDFSTDNSEKIVTNLTDLDLRFKIINLESNRGVSFARNKGLEKSSGRYVAFLDSDDLWHRNFLKSSMDIREGRDIPITHCPYVRFMKKDKNYLGKVIYPPRLIRADNIGVKNYLPLLTAVLDRKIIGDFRFKEIRPEDYLLWIELIEDRGFYSEILPLIGAFYRVSENQRSNNKIKSIKRIYSLYKKERKLNGFTSIKKTLKWGYNNIKEKKAKYNSMRSLNKEIAKEFYQLIENNF